MRAKAKSGALQVRAIGGLHVVTLAWDFLPGQDAKREGLMGFALERAELTNGGVAERYYLRLLRWESWRRDQ